MAKTPKKKRKMSAKQRANLKKGQRILGLMYAGHSKAEARKIVAGE